MTTPTITHDMIAERVARSKKLRLIFTAVPEMGHFIPLMRLAGAARDAGHDVSILAFKYHEEKCINMLKQSDMEDVPIEFPDPGYTRHEVTVGVDYKTTGKKKMFQGTEGAIEPAC